MSTARHATAIDGLRMAKHMAEAGLTPQIPTPSVSEDASGARGGDASGSKKHVLRDGVNGRFTKRPRSEQEEDERTSKHVRGLEQQICSLRKEVDQKNALIIQLTGDLHLMAKDHEQEVSNLKRALKAANNFCEGYLKILLENKDALAAQAQSTQPGLVIGAGSCALDVVV